MAASPKVRTWSALSRTRCPRRSTCSGSACPARNRISSTPAPGFVGPGRVLILLRRPEQWQVGILFPKGTYQQLRGAGLDTLKSDLVKLVPWFADRVDSITDWRQILLLSIQSGRLSQWYKPGLLFIGDAAHTMSPVCAVGINYAIQDSVVATNVLRKPLKAGQVDIEDLAEVQRLPDGRFKFVQTAQGIVQKKLLATMATTQENTPWKPSFALKILSVAYPMARPARPHYPLRIVGTSIWRSKPMGPSTRNVIVDDAAEEQPTFRVGR